MFIRIFRKYNNVGGLYCNFHTTQNIDYVYRIGESVYVFPFKF